MIARRSILHAAPAPALAIGLVAPSIGTAATREMSMDLQSIIATSREKVRTIMARDGIPGASVVLLDRDRPAWLECFGATDHGQARAIDPHTIFSLQSTSKTFAATAVMIAVQRGLLDLDQPITAYLPDFTVSSRHEQDPQARITLRLLLSHRAGFTHEAPLGRNFEPGRETASPSFEAHVESISRTWLRYPLGERYAYSNLGIDLAGYILMKACGAASYGMCLKSLIFDPLGMRDTTAAPDTYTARENRAIGHQPGFDAVPVRVPMEAAGGVYSSAADMARYTAFHLGKGTLDGRTILRQGLWEEMHTPTYQGFPYALGIEKRTLHLGTGNLVVFNHNGGGYGFGCSFTYCPDQQLAWVVMYNGQTRGGPPAPFDDVALQPILKAEFGAPTTLRPPVAAPAQPASEVLQPHTGTFVAGISYLAMKLDAGGLAFSIVGEQGSNRLAFSGEDEAHVVEGPRTPQAVRFHAPRGLEGAWLELGDGSYFDYNDSDRDAPGSAGDRYDAHLGSYDVIQWGVTILKISLLKKNGYLYLGGIRTIEHLPGLLFTGDGEALDLRGSAPTMRNVTLLSDRP